MRRIAAGGSLVWHQHALRLFGSNAHLCDLSGPSIDLSSLEAECLYAADKLDAWIELQTKSGTYSARAAWIEQSDSVVKLCQLERIGIMALSI
jgi:hypothetical protein